MKKMFILTAIVGLLACGCTSNEEVYNNYHKEGNTSFSVTVEQPVLNETRAHLDENFYVVFDEEDKIAVFDKNTTKSEYTFNGSEFSGNSSTEGEALDAIYALYPSSGNVSYNSGTLPDVQTYCENSFSNESQIMYGKTDNIEDGFNLKNMCGYIRLHLYGENVSVKEITLSVTGENEYVSGNFQIEASDEGDDYALTMNNEGENQKQYVKLVYPEDGVKIGTTSENATVFYIALPPQKYTKGFSVTITDIFGRDMTRTAFSENGFELERNHIKPMDALRVDNVLNEALKIVKDNNDDKQYAIVDDKEDLCKWGYIINNVNKTLGMKLQANIEMPKNVIKLDSETKTYIFTDEEITITDGVPSGSNWMPLGTQISSTDLSKAFKGNIDGGGNSITGLCINSENTGVGLIGCFCDGSITNLSLKESYVKGGQATGGVVGYCRYNSTIDNISIIDCDISGTSNVGGVVGYIYRRTRTGDETIPYIIDCNVDESSTVNGTSNYIGGICGYNYGAAIIHCINSADVTGASSVGGILGYTRSYWNNGVSGYVIASGTTNKATVKANSGYAGGIAGTSFLDGTHFNAGSDSYIVACYSNSDVEASKPGTMIGTGGTGIASSIIASWAQKYDLTNSNGDKPSQIKLIYSNHYSDANEISENIVNDMNVAIYEYNNSVQDVDVNSQIKCHYKWQYNADGWPTLIPITGESN